MNFFNGLSIAFSTGANFVGQTYDAIKSISSTAIDIGGILFSDSNEHLSNAGGNINNAAASVGYAAGNTIQATTSFGAAAINSCLTGRNAYIAAAPVAAKYVADTAIANVLAPASVGPVTAFASSTASSVATLAIAHPVVAISVIGGVVLLTTNREKVIEATKSLGQAGNHMLNAATEIAYGIKEVIELSAERLSQISDYLNDTAYNADLLTSEEVSIALEEGGEEIENFVNIVENRNYLNDLEDSFILVENVELDAEIEIAGDMEIVADAVIAA